MNKMTTTYGVLRADGESAYLLIWIGSRGRPFNSRGYEALRLWPPK